MLSKFNRINQKKFLQSAIQLFLEGKKWLCKFCTEEKIQNIKHGYNNGLSHIKTYGWRLAMVDGSQTTLDSIIDNKSSNAFRWLKWILDLSFSFINKPETRENTNLKPLDRHTLTKYMNRVVLQVECVFQGVLPSFFGVAMES